MADYVPKLGQLCDETARRDAIHVAVAPVEAGERLQPGEFVGLVDGKARRGGELVGIVDPFLLGPVEKGQRFWLCLYPGTITALRHVWSHPAFEAASAAARERWEAAGRRGGEPVSVAREDFLRRLEADEDDAATRLVYADWLEDRGEDDEAARQRAWPAAKAWLVEFASRHTNGGEEAIIWEDVRDAGREYIETGGNSWFTQIGDESLRDEMRKDGQRAEFWRCVSVVTGLPVPEWLRDSHPFSCSC